MVETKVKYYEKKVIRRTLGMHLTSKDIFRDYIFPSIKDKYYDFLWVDLYAGEGNLILPMLNSIPESKKIKFFSKHLFMFDIQEEMVDKCIENAESYGIPRNIAEKNILQYDSLANFPKFLKEKPFPIFHVTNPPYLYLGYIKKHKETQRHLKYFKDENTGYQDLYQVAMMNDLRNNVKKLIYIIPSNFIFGSSVSNKFRLDFLIYYDISNMYIFEKKIFKHTGTNICISFFERKERPKRQTVSFRGIKIKKNKELKITYYLKPEFKYRAGAEFDEFLMNFRTNKPLIVKYYLQNKEVYNNRGSFGIDVIDTSNYVSNQYKLLKIYLNKNLRDKVKSNILYIRTVDTGGNDKRAGVYEIKKDFKVDGIYVSKATYRTSPIQIFLEPQISYQDQIILKDFFNFILEYFREKLDSEFLTTYKYSNSKYTRKYLGLTQVRSLIETFPILSLNKNYKEHLRLLIENKNYSELKEFIKSFCSNGSRKITCFIRNN